MTARIILLNGPSSAGKSTLARALRPLLPANFCFYASDQLADAGFRPLDPDTRWQTREAFFAGFHHSIAAFAAAGLDLLVEHIVEQPAWGRQLRAALRPFDCFWVGLQVPLPVLKARERARGDRAIDEAQEHAATHNHCDYDLMVDHCDATAVVARQVLAAWRQRHASTARHDPPGTCEAS